MRSCVFVIGVLLASVSAAEPETAVDSLINTTELGQNLKTLEDYYGQVNNQLNNQIKNRQRDPFEKLVQPIQVDESGLPKPRFVPRERNEKGELSQLNKNGKGQRLLPLMQFRGFIQSDEDKAGLLEIEGQGTFVVYEGDKVGLQKSGGDMVIRVVEINALNLIVEFGSLGEKVVVQ